MVSIGINNYSSDDVGSILDDEYNICVRTGYHCAPLVHDFIGSLEYNGTVRISLNYFNPRLRNIWKLTGRWSLMVSRSWKIRGNRRTLQSTGNQNEIN